MAQLNFGGTTETVVIRDEFPLEKAREVLKNETIAVIGYGVQGPGQALNLRDNGFNVIVGQRQGKTYDKAVADGWVPGETLFGIEEACEKGTIIMCLLSDAAVMSVWPTIKPYLTAGKALYFSHGFAITWSDRTGVVPPADILLIQGTWDSIARMSQKQSQWVVLGQPLEEASKVTLDYKAPVAALIMVLMIAAMVFDFIPIPPVEAVIIAGILMVLTGCFRNVEEAYKTINWESVVLIAAMLPMSLALEKTGASNLISEKLVSGLGDYGPLVLMAGIYFTTSLLTMFISNTATAVLVAPIALQSAIAIHDSEFTVI